METHQRLYRLQKAREIMQELEITKPIRLIELFAGVGSQAMALRNIGIEFEHHVTCEWWV